MKNPLCSLVNLLLSKKKSQQSDLPEDICREFSLAEIKAATNNFNQGSIIGSGAYGTVFKGIIDDGTTVAVKRCHSISAGIRVYRNDVQFLCQLRHPHLVSLIGFCLVEKDMFVVLEYMSRGSLADVLYRKDNVPRPDWKHRLQICIGAARGLHYLHTGAKRAVIHRDIKTSNILLGEDWYCKLSDFGLSKLGPRSMSKALIRMETQVAGTIGYLAPEYAMRGDLTEKSDVYSFGVVLFEVLLGRAPYDSTLPRDQLCLLGWVEESVREGTIYHAIDPYLKGNISPHCLNKYLEIASSCVHRRGDERRAMGEVEVTLELALDLQDRGDSEMEATNPTSECMYEEALFSTFVRNFTGLSSHRIREDANDLSDSDSYNSNYNS